MSEQEGHRARRSTVKTTLQRRGIQLLELVISMVTANILVAAIGSSIWIANVSLERAVDQSSSAMQNQAGLDRLRCDLAEAYPATNRTSTSVTLSVADRNGDGQRDQLQYQWNGAEDPLLFSMNGEPLLPITGPLQEFSLNWNSVTVPQAPPVQLQPSGSFTFIAQEFSQGTFADKMSIDVPETYVEGDLLVVVVAVTGAHQGNISANGGWTKWFEQDNSSEITLAIFATTTEPNGNPGINWPSSQAYFAITAHFQTPSGSAQVTDLQYLMGADPTCITPSASALGDRSLVLRAMAANGPLVLEDAANMPQHVTIGFRRQLLANPIVGLTFQQVPEGSVSNANFVVASTARYVTATVVIAP